MQSTPPGSSFRRAVLVAGLALAFSLGLEGLEPFFFLRDDNSSVHLPAYAHSFRSLAEDGELALVNPHQYLGIQHLASGSPAVLYPPTYLAVLAAGWSGDLRRAIDWLVAGHLILGAIGMLFLLRQLGLGRHPGWHGGDVAGALLWMTSPFLVLTSRAWMPLAFTGAFVPWSVFLFLRMLDVPSWRRVLAYGSVKTIFFFAGYPQSLIVVCLLEIGYWLASSATELAFQGRASLARLARQGGAIAVAALWTASTSAPLLLPMLETVRSSFMRREPLPFAVFSEFPLRLADFAAAQIFVVRSEVFLTASSSIYFVGLPMLLALAAFWIGGWRRQRGITVLAALALVALLASTSAWGVVYGAPVLSSFRWPAKNFLYFVFASIPAVCLVYERLVRRAPRWAVAGLILSLGGSFVVLAVPEWRQTMGDATLDRPIAEYRQYLETACGDGGRVVALRKQGTLTASRWDELAPYLAAYNYATLLGRHHLGGHEPLVSETHFALSAGMNYTATLSLAKAEPALFRHLAHWGVGCVLVPELPGVDSALSGVPGLRRIGSHAGIVSYRLDATPVVGWVDTGRPVAFRWTSNGLVAQLDGRGGALRIAVAPLTQWTLEADGPEIGRVAIEPRIDRRSGLFVPVPSGTEELRLGYREPKFELGVWIALLAVAVAALFAAVGGRRPPDFGGGIDAGCRAAAIDGGPGRGYAGAGSARADFVCPRRGPSILARRRPPSPATRRGDRIPGPLPDAPCRRPPIDDVAKETAIEKEEPIQLEGTVSEVLGNANFRVQVTEDHSVLAKIAGKMRRHRIRVLPGDRVKVEVTPYDLERGRIVYRYRN